MLRKIILVVISVIALYSAFILLSDINTIYEKISNFKTEFLPIIFSLIFFGWFLLFLRWNLLLKSIFIIYVIHGKVEKKKTFL